MAKRSKGFGKLLHQQRADQAQQKALEKLKQKVQQGALSSQITEVVVSPSGAAKMSEVLEAFVEPYLGFVENRRQHEQLLGMAVLAWNLALLPDDKRQSTIEQAVEQILTEPDPRTRRDTREILAEMISRKQLLFADNKRYIVEFQLQDAGQEFHLSVASTLTGQPASEP